MAFTARLDSVARAGDPLFFDLGVTYLESTLPDWSVAKTLRVTIDPALTAAQQQANLRLQIITDASKYKAQLAVDAALQQLVGNIVAIP